MVTRVISCKMHEFLTESGSFAWFTHLLLVGYSLVTRLCSAEFLWCSFFWGTHLKKGTDLDKNARILPERCHFSLLL